MLRHEEGDWVASDEAALFLLCLRLCWGSLALVGCIGAYTGIQQFSMVFIGSRKRKPLLKRPRRYPSSPRRTRKFNPSTSGVRISNKKPERVSAPSLS